MLNKVKEMGNTIGKKVVKNKKKIAIVAGGVAVGFIGFKTYQYKSYVSGVEKISIEGAKGTYELLTFPKGDGQMLSGDDWFMFGNKGTLQPEVIEDALRNAFGLVE